MHRMCDNVNCVTNSEFVQLVPLKHLIREGSSGSCDWKKIRLEGVNPLCAPGLAAVEILYQCHDIWRERERNIQLGHLILKIENIYTLTCVTSYNIIEQC